MSTVLLIASGVALAMLVVHCRRMRARDVTWAFFLAAIAFGILRGHCAWFAFTRIDEGISADRPYSCPDARFSVGQAYLQEAVGWAFALYLAWTVSELVLRRLPRLRQRVFMVAGLSSLFMLAICYTMETTAVRVGWWNWALPTRTDLFGNVNSFAMTAWFSVVPDFLLPFLVIVCTPLRDSRWYVRWAWTLVFVPHVLGVAFFGWREWTHLTTIALALGVVALVLFSRLRVFFGEIDDAKGSPLVRALPAAALAIFFAVVVGANLVAGGGLAEIMTAAPLLMLCLLAWRRVPVSAVVALSVALAAGGGLTSMGPRALWALVPVAAFGVLKLVDRLDDPAWLRLSLSAGALALSAVVVIAHAADLDRSRRYIEAWQEGDRHAVAGDEKGAAECWRAAESLRPADTINLYCAIRRAAPPDSSPAWHPSGRLRVEHLERELSEVLRRDPDWSIPRLDLARLRSTLANPALETSSGN